MSSLPINPESRALPKSPKSTRLTDQAKLRNKNARLEKKLREQKAYSKRLAQIIAKERRENDAKLRKILKNVVGKGIYEPKSTDLTKYRRTRAAKIARTFGEMLDPTKYFFIPVPKAKRNEALSRAQSLGLSQIKTPDGKTPASKTGLFVSRENYKKARLEIDKKSGELSIVKSGKVKNGPNAGKQYVSRLPLASVDTLTREENRLRALAESYGPLKGNEQLAFQVVEDGYSGYSHMTFSNVDLLIEYLNNIYSLNVSQRINFYRHIEIVKVEYSKKWFEAHPRTDAGQRGKHARRRALGQSTTVCHAKKNSKITVCGMKLNRVKSTTDISQVTCERCNRLLAD